MGTPVVSLSRASAEVLEAALSSDAQNGLAGACAIPPVDAKAGVDRQQE